MPSSERKITSGFSNSFNHSTLKSLSVSTQSMLRGYLLFMSVYVRPNCPFILQHILLFYITTFMFMFEYDFCIYLWVHMSVHFQEGPKLTLRVFSFILYFNHWGRISVEDKIASSLYPGCPIAPDILSLHLQCWDTGLPNIYLDAVFWTVIFMIVQQMHYHWVSLPGCILTQHFLLSRVLPKYCSANVSEHLLS